MIDPFSMTPRRPSRFDWRIAAFFLLWTAAALLAAWWFAWRTPESRVVFVSLDPIKQGEPVDRATSAVLLKQQLLPWLPWLLLAPYVLWLAGHFHFSGRWKWRNGGVLLVTGGAFVLLCMTVQEAIGRRQPILAPLPAIETWFPPGMDKTPGGEFGIPLTRAIGLDPAVPIPEAYGLPPEVDPRRLPGAIVTREEMKRRIETDWAKIASRSEATLGGLPESPATAVVLLDAFAFLALIVFSHAWVFLRTARRENERAALLDLRHTQARARALQAQLQPHFLFNTLNGIAMLTRKNPAVAEEMITSLSELLRIALDGERKPEIPLRDELEFIDRYIDIQRMRFGDRLKIERSIERETLDVLVPALLIQPLVENAIHHGIEPKGEGGSVRIATALKGGLLEIAIEDDGVSMGASGAGSGAGIGLASIRERLAALHPLRHQFRIEEPAGGGVRMVIQMPARRAADAA